MGKTTPHRVRYGSAAAADSPRPSLGRWMALVTATIVAALFLHFCAFLIVGPPRTGALIPSYISWWRQFLGPKTPGEPDPEVVEPALQPPLDPLAMPATDSALPDASAEAELLTYFPLNDANAWQYRTVTEKLGNEEAPGQILFRVIEVDRSGDHPKYRASVESIEFIYQVRGTDLTLTQPGNQTLVPLRAPLTEGTSWESPPGAMRYTIAGFDDARTPLGEFDDCLKLEKESLTGGAGSTLYYAPGVGLVRQEVRMGMAERQIWELEGYRVNGRTAGTLAPKDEVQEKEAEEPAATEETN